MSLEYRVYWKRDGCRAKTLIYQSFDAACRKLKAIKATEELKGEFPRIADMSDLVEARLEVRTCAPWRLHDYQPAPYEFESMRAYLSWKEPDFEPIETDGNPF